MKTLSELQAAGLAKPMIKEKYGFKIPEKDLEILVSVCKDSRFAENLKSDFRSYANLAELIKFYVRKEKSKDYSPIIVDEKEFEKLEEQNAMFRATSNEPYDVNFFLNSKIVLRNGDNGSGIYFSEGSGSYLPRYVISHLRDKPVNENTGNIYKVALNPDASFIDRTILYMIIKDLTKAIDDGCYSDGTKLNIGCDKELLKRVISCDFAVVALLLGANAIYVPYKENALVQGDKKFLGHYVLFDKKPVIVTSNTLKLNTKVDITNLKANSENSEKEIERIKSVLTKR